MDNWPMPCTCKKPPPCPVHGEQLLKKIEGLELQVKEMKDALETAEKILERAHDGSVILGLRSIVKRGLSYTDQMNLIIEDKMTPEEIGKAVWDKLPPVYGPDDEKESMRLIGQAILDATKASELQIGVWKEKFLEARQRVAGLATARQQHDLTEWMDAQLEGKETEPK